MSLRHIVAKFTNFPNLIKFYCWLIAKGQQLIAKKKTPKGLFLLIHKSFDRVLWSALEVVVKHLYVVDLGICWKFLVEHNAV